MPGFMPRPTEILAAARERGPAAERLLGALVNQPSGSRNAEGVARVLDALGAALADLGFRIDLVREAGVPRHLCARRGEGPPVVLIGHADTVFPASDGRRFAVDGEGDVERYRGPGCADMKGGLVVAIEALRAVVPALARSGGAVEVIVNGDEELGSPGSRELIRERAARARAALVFENSEEEDGVIVGRKGLGKATIRIRGRGAHAGVAPEKGASAGVEMARKILDVAALDDPPGGVGVVIGTARGGISRNTVPPEAEMEIDLRYREKTAGARAFDAIRAIAERPGLAGTSAAFEGELHRPPMPPETAAGDLFERAGRAAGALGLRPLRRLTSGGGSDANLTADLGVPTLDGLGIVGGDIHTVDEWALRRSLPERAALAAVLLGDLLELRD